MAECWNAGEQEDWPRSVHYIASQKRLSMLKCLGKDNLITQVGRCSMLMMILVLAYMKLASSK